MSEVQQLECSLCGRDVEERPPIGCGVCHGNASVRSRAYTLSDIKNGRGPQEERHDGESLNPKPSPLVVGGAINHPSHPEN
jgi:hypothetical protein